MVFLGKTMVFLGKTMVFLGKTMVFYAFRLKFLLLIFCVLLLFALVFWHDQSYWRALTLGGFAQIWMVMAI